MDKDLANGARKLFAENLFETVKQCYCEANKDYLVKQLKIASEYLTEEQKKSCCKRVYPFKLSQLNDHLNN